MIRAVFFDFDGTLADTRQVFLNCYPQIAKKYGLKVLPLAELEKLKSLPIRTRLKAAGIPMSKLPGLVRDARAASEQYMDSCPAYPGIAAVVRTLAEEGLYLAIISSNARENILRFLKAQRLEVFAQVLTSSGIYGKHRVIKKLLLERGLHKKEAVYVGDELRDIVSCRKVPLAVIAVTWGYDAASLLRQGEPDFLINEPREILPSIAELNQRTFDRGK
ncbi:MAG TPA: HAD hydrolase-like protein [Bacillota bacterium]|nr:HAD hydrolase-like protein [Bacillota bacterium]